jgi:hypothetical protein
MDSPKEKILKRNKEILDFLAAERRRCLMKIMGTPEGRWWVWDLLDSLKVFTPVWHNSGSEMAKRAGMQEKGLTVLYNLWDTCPSEYRLMQDEYLKFRTDLLKRFPEIPEES